MPLFLNEHQLGFDTQKICFPNLGGCMGIVLQTPTGLYGFHFTPGSTAQGGPFKEFFDASQKTRGVTDPLMHLYGCCRRGRRYPGSTDAKAQWMNDMKEIADELTYHGKISGCDLSRASHGPTDAQSDQSVYAEYERVSAAADCVIRYKRMSKMTPTKGDKTTDYGIERVKRDPNSRGDDYVLAKPHHSTISVDVKLDTTKTKSETGKMHTVPKLDSFVY